MQRVGGHTILIMGESIMESRHLEYSEGNGRILLGWLVVREKTA